MLLIRNVDQRICYVCYAEVEMCNAQQINLKRNQTAKKNPNNISKKFHCLWTMAFVSLKHLKPVLLIVMLDTASTHLPLAVNATYVSNQIRAWGKILQNQINTYTRTEKELTTVEKNSGCPFICVVYMYVSLWWGFDMNSPFQLEIWPLA